MSGPVRLAGSVRRADGSLVTWTLAEGRKGRRWREVVAGDGDGLARWALLYETDPAGRFSHLELAVPGGLVTLHPEGDGTLHGNVVHGTNGVRHIIGEPFPAGTALLVAGSLVAGAAVARWSRTGASAVVLDPRALTLTHRPVAPDDLVPVDADGAPLPAGGRRWPLEVDATD